MKNIRRLLAFAVVLLSAAACHTNEIDNPDNNQNPEKPQSSEVKLMAKIPQTRVTYTSTGSRLDQAWAEGDIVFGFYEEDSRVILRVGKPDEDGTAPLSPVSGYERFITELVSHATDADHLPVALVYTGSTSTDESRLYNDNTITVSKNNQSSGQLPACMHANGYAVITDSESKTFVFDFDNDCAIFEIIGITGAEALSFGNKDKLALDYINVTNVINSIEYSYSDGDITFAPNTDLNGIFKLPSGIYVDMYGNVVDSNGNNTSIMMAVVPNGEQDFIIKIDFENREHLELPYHGNLAAGKCYVFSQKAIVAAVGNEVFETVTAAFAKAKANYLDEDPNTTVVLVRDCGLAGVTKQDGSYVSNIGGKTPISIDNYNVTFDLNGHTLTLDNYEFFNVSAGNTFIIKDSSDDKGIIQSNYTDDDGYHLIKNYGTVQLEGGQLRHNKDWSAVRNYQNSTLVVNGGVLYSYGYFAIDNRDASVTINKGNISADYAVINNVGELTINGGTISSESTYNIIENSDCLKINGGTVSSSGTGSAIWSDGGTVDISGGVISNKSNEAIKVESGANCTISGGTIYCLNQDNNAPVITCYSADGAAKSTLTITWPISKDKDGNIKKDENGKIKYDQESGEENHEPLIYSAGNKNSSVPVNSFYTSWVNKAEITINGGYLISCNPNNVFYLDDSGANIQLKEKEDQTIIFGEFYSNMPGIGISGNTSSFVFHSLADGNGYVIGGGLCFKASQYNNDTEPKLYGSILLPSADGSSQYSGNLYKIFYFPNTL